MLEVYPGDLQVEQKTSSWCQKSQASSLLYHGSLCVPNSMGTDFSEDKLRKVTGLQEDAITSQPQPE